MEFIFEIRDAEGGGICAGALGHAIFAEDETWQELRANVLEKVTSTLGATPFRSPTRDRSACARRVPNAK